MASKDGFTWTPSGGKRAGLPCIGVISPSTHFVQPEDDPFDTIVIGTGYAGLVASRDLTTQGKKTLVIEARDRLGGRTWSSSIDGFNYEMGGTWIHWHMPHIYREVSFYGLHNDWLVTQIPGGKEDYCTLTTDNDQRNMSHDDEADIVGRAFEVFANVDGDSLRHTWKYAFGTGQSPELMAKWDRLSCQERLDQLQAQDQLTPDETSVLTAFLVQAGGNDLDRLGLLDALRWWVLGSHSRTGLNDIALHTRLGSGHSELHRRIFHHALSTGNLSYTFDTPVTRIEQKDGLVTVTARDGHTWKAKAVVLTIPLNVLSSIEFSPPLSKNKQDAARQGSMNFTNKVHIDMQGPDWVSWSSLASPGKGTVAAFGDRLTPDNNTHLVAFGPDPSSSTGTTLEDMEVVRDSFVHLLPENKRSGVQINKIVSHDWNRDEFSKGAWCFLPPKFTTKYLTALQQPHGNVLFASGDWSDGWRGWIDGAVQIGMQAAQRVMELQRKPSGDKKVVNGSNIYL
ncbi:amine oxidase [Penicillium concentricum]|uniref:Amine oxidase n=1 Tax=Penicillium concentricum TaxID=293559 RepID=A0A9W9SRS9_9EURO|nr:amine oxidase [Penicillium concentricum]KAJ5382634.1 amine oxidase [Penicillium concentricum]